MAGLKFARRFAPDAGGSVLDKITWEKRRAEIKEPSGQIVFEMDGVEVPADWSYTASNVLAQKYFRKAGVPEFRRSIDEKDVPIWLRRRVPTAESKKVGETSARQVFSRLAGCWTYWGWKTGTFGSEQDARNFHDDVLWLLAHQMLAPNSPQYFNTGLHWAYGIEGPPQGMWYVDPADGVARESPNAYERMASSACFLLSVQDDLTNPGGIMDLWVRESRIFKFGGGAGSCVSPLRAEGEDLTGGGQSSGPLSFLKIGDAAAGGIKSAGTTRRAAKMVCMHDDHPDVEKFIDWKRDEEMKVASLVIGSQILRREAEALRHKGRQSVLSAEASGLPPQLTKNLLAYYEQRGKEDPWLPKEYDLDWRSEAYRTVSGQNANNSVRISNAFMKALEEGGEWELKRRTDGKVAKTIKAEALWDRINTACWAVADPGILFDDVINDWNTTPEVGRVNTCNPCAEVHQPDDTACNLLSTNLRKFLRPDGTFQVGPFVAANEIGATILEITVAMGHLPSKKVAENVYRQRQLGLGYANLGSLLMTMGVSYDSERGRAIAAAITCIMHSTVGAQSARMAEALGPFADYEKCKQSMLRVVRNHRAAAYRDDQVHFVGLSIEPPRISEEHCPDYLLEAARSCADKMVALGEAYGYRNAQFSVMAPTGTISLVMDCDTSSLEPGFSLVTFKTLAGGGTIKLVNSSVGEALRRLGYDESQISQVEEHVLATGTVVGSAVKGEHLAIFDCAMGRRPICPEGHVRMVAAIQPFLSGASSKTINCPESWTVEDFKEFHLLGYRLGAKCMAAFRNGCKLSQPLESFDVGADEVEAEAAAHVNGAAGHEPAVPVGCAPAGWPSGQRRRLPDRRQGYTQKARIGETKIYLRTGEYEDGTLGEIFIDLHKEGATFRSVMSQFSIAVSIALQYGVPLEAFVERFAFTRFAPSGVVTGHKHLKMATSLFDFIFRELAVTYLGRMDLAEVPFVPADMDGTSTRDEVLKELQAGQPALATLDGFADRPEKAKKRKPRSQPTGESCTTCGNFSLTRTGPCVRCDVCGSSSGCG